MNTRKNILALAVVMVFSISALADVPKLINYQGRLTTPAGVPVPNAAYSVTFTIYDVPAGGTNLWSETNSVTTSAGLFAVLLGNNVALPDGLFSDTTRYIGIKVSTDPELTPRQRLVSVPYSYRVSTVDGATGGTITSKVSIGPGHINTGTDAFVAGANNRARGAYSVVSGGGGATATDSNSANGIYSTIGGGQKNTALFYATTVGGGTQNAASNTIATIGGGNLNTASGYAGTVGGGEGNFASGPNATVCGGGSNLASGSHATIGGGQGNTASGNNTFVAGLLAGALHNGTFVWSSGFGLNQFNSTGDNQFLISAPGGVGIGTNSPAHPLHMASGAHVTAGGVWTNASSRELKTDIEPLKNEEYSDILKKLEALEVVHFKYKAEPDVAHIGMIAEDVPNEMASPDRKGIPTADAIAFLVAAVKAQIEQLKGQQSQIEDLKATVKELKGLQKNK